MLTKNYYSTLAQLFWILIFNDVRLQFLDNGVNSVLKKKSLEKPDRMFFGTEMTVD